MPSVLVRDLPDEVHVELQRRAEARGQSLQQYLAGELRRLAERPTLEEVLERISHRRAGRVGFQQAVADLGDLAVDRYPTLPLMPRAFELRANVTPYDAAYVALAEGLACALLTADARLARTPRLRCAVRLLTSTT